MFRLVLTHLALLGEEQEQTHKDNSKHQNVRHGVHADTGVDMTTLVVGDGHTIRSAIDLLVVIIKLVGSFIITTVLCGSVIVLDYGIGRR